MCMVAADEAGRSQERRASQCDEPRRCRPRPPRGVEFLIASADATVPMLNGVSEPEHDHMITGSYVRTRD